ncbi:hypothetical protein [Oceanobacillus senegalensis]|uniref:hypothetical protein n=1 Tax=Oceanobacillus senegalensis TaxID=1936063 RepID=UPI00117D45FF|nr:hypothetical protein [Oceanobacillus senegalensis]
MTDNPTVLIPFLIVNFAIIFIHFKFQIVEGSLIFQVHLFTLTIYKKKVDHQQIDRMTVKRVGWGKKRSVTVKSKKGFNLRISNFYPEKTHNDLMDFASEYGIPVSKV